MTRDRTTTHPPRARRAAGAALAGAAALASTGCVYVQGRPDTTDLTVEAGSVAQICVDTTLLGVVDQGPLAAVRLQWQWDNGHAGIESDQIPDASPSRPNPVCRTHTYTTPGTYHGSVSHRSDVGDGAELPGTVATFTVHVVPAPPYQLYVDAVPGEPGMLYAQLTHADQLGTCSTKVITLSTPPPSVAPVGSSHPVTYLAGEPVPTPAAGTYLVNLHVVCEHPGAGGATVRVDWVFSTTATSA